MVDLGLEPGLLDVAVADGLRLQGVGFLLLLGGLAVGPGLRDARQAGDGGRVRSAQVLDVRGRVGDLLDLKRVHDQPQLLHLGA